MAEIANRNPMLTVPGGPAWTPDQVFDRIRKAVPSSLAGEGAPGRKGPGRVGADAS